MKLVNINGGDIQLVLHNAETKDKSKSYLNASFDENRIKYFVPADYSEDSKLENVD